MLSRSVVSHVAIVHYALVVTDVVASVAVAVAYVVHIACVKVVVLCHVIQLVACVAVAVLGWNNFN